MDLDHSGEDEKIDCVARQARLRAEVNALKERPCADCGHQYDSWVMDLDHRGEDEKIACVVRLVARGRRKAALIEAKKCDVVCSNCHRQRTHIRLQNARIAQ
jgi:hypothetical protein